MSLDYVYDFEPEGKENQNPSVCKLFILQRELERIIRNNAPDNPIQVRRNLAGESGISLESLECVLELKILYLNPEGLQKALDIGRVKPFDDLVRFLIDTQMLSYFPDRE